MGGYIRQIIHMKLNKKQKRQETPADREGKKRPFQDDTALIIAAAIILIVAQAYILSLSEPQGKQKMVIVRTQNEDVERTVNQDLSLQRQSIEEHIKQFLFMPDAKADNPALKPRQAFFSSEGWSDYQQYLHTDKPRLAEGQSLRAEFVFGSQRYALIGDDNIAFRADGLFCRGMDKNFTCGPQRFQIEILMRGDVNAPDALTFEKWSVVPPTPVVAGTP